MSGGAFLGVFKLDLFFLVVFHLFIYFLVDFSRTF